MRSPPICGSTCRRRNISRPRRSRLSRRTAARELLDRLDEQAHRRAVVERGIAQLASLGCAELRALDLAETGRSKQRTKFGFRPPIHVPQVVSILGNEIEEISAQGASVTALRQRADSGRI